MVWFWQTRQRSSSDNFCRRFSATGSAARAASLTSEANATVDPKKRPKTKARIRARAGFGSGRAPALGVPGTPGVIGSVPVEDKETGDRWVEVTLVPDEAVSEIWIGASVTVKVVDELAADVLVVPVSSLVSLVEGGYAVEVVDGSSSKLVGVETGMYADGFVEISGDGLDAGQTVAVPT